jgi:outer membrane protein assembly factor BamD (BamD/ComL family)
MPRLKTIAILVLTGLCFHFFQEVREVRRDQEEMFKAYESFLATKVKGFPMSEYIKEGSTAAFRSSKGTVVCAILK